MGSGSAASSRRVRTQKYREDAVFMGEEPDLPAHFTDVEYVRALGWYARMCDADDYAQYIADWLRSHNREAEAKAILRVLKKAPDRLSSTAAGIARMLVRGAELPGQATLFLEKKLKEALDFAGIEVDDEEVIAPKRAPHLHIQAKISNKASDVIGDLEEMIDSSPEEYDLDAFFAENNVTAQVARKIAQMYRPLMVELETLRSKDCPDDLKEAYKGIKKARYLWLVKFLAELLAICDEEIDDGVSERKPREKKPVTPEKLLKFFKHLEEFDDIKSVPAKKIIGAQELWTYDTKYRRITVFRASGPSGLTVHRTSIAGYDEATSMTKSAGRKNDEVVETVRTGTKVQLRKVMDTIKAEPKKLAERINEDTILLRIF